MIDMQNNPRYRAIHLSKVADLASTSNRFPKCSHNNVGRFAAGPSLNVLYYIIDTAIFVCRKLKCVVVSLRWFFTGIKCSEKYGRVHNAVFGADVANRQMHRTVH